MHCHSGFQMQLKFLKKMVTLLTLSFRRMSFWLEWHVPPTCKMICTGRQCGKLTQLVPSMLPAKVCETLQRRIAVTFLLLEQCWWHCRATQRPASALTLPAPSSRMPGQIADLSVFQQALCLNVSRGMEPHSDLINRLWRER